MADRATAASTAAAVGEQKYLAALNILRTDIARAKSSQSKAGGEASQAYTRIEKMGVNKKGAGFIASLLTTETSIAEDVMRTVINLATAANLMPREDLVDLADRMTAEGDETKQNAGRDDDDDGSDGDGDDVIEPKPDPAPVDGGGAAVDAAGNADDDGAQDAPQKPHDTPDAEWDAAGEALAAKAKVGKQPTPAEARAARKRQGLRAVPEALSSATTH